jgi:hypothetical protein
LCLPIGRGVLKQGSAELFFNSAAFLQRQALHFDTSQLFAFEFEDRRLAEADFAAESGEVVARPKFLGVVPQNTLDTLALLDSKRVENINLL